MRFTWVAFVLVGTACSTTPGPRIEPDLAAPVGVTDGGLADAATNSDGGLPDAADTADAGYVPTYRNSLGVCWTDATCKRALAVAHGGEWSFAGAPYDSDGAIAAAYANGADGVKVDVRFTSDMIGVIAHSSPIQLYESLDCGNRKIEEMTAAEVVKCHRFPSQTETFQRLDSVLAYARGKLVVQLCVKRPVDTAQTVAAVLAAGAEDFAFLELSTTDFQAQVPTVPNGNKVYYLAQVNAPSEVDTLLITIQNPRAFMYEFEPNDATVSQLVTDCLHPAGIRSFTYDKDASSTPAIKALFDAGFDVVSTNANVAAVAARIQINTARGISPP